MYPEHKLETAFFWCSAISYAAIIALLIYGSLTRELPTERKEVNANVATK